MRFFDVRSHWVKAGIFSLLAAIGSSYAVAGDDGRRSDDSRPLPPRRIPKPVNDRFEVAREEMERAEDNAARNLADRQRRSSRYDDRDTRSDERYDDGVYVSRDRDRDRDYDDSVEQARFLRRKKERIVSERAEGDCDCGGDHAVQGEMTYDERGGVVKEGHHKKPKLNDWRDCNEDCDCNKHKGGGKIVSVRKAAVEAEDCGECSECGKRKDKCGCKLFGKLGGKKKCETCGSGDGICDKRCLDPGCNREACPCPTQEVLSYYRCGYYGYFPTFWRPWPENWLKYRPAPSETMYDRFRKPKPGETGNEQLRNRNNAARDRDRDLTEPGINRNKTQDPDRLLERGTNDLPDNEVPRSRQKLPPKELTPDQKSSPPKKTSMLRLPRNDDERDDYNDMSNARPATRRF